MNLENNPFMAEVVTIQEKQLAEKNEDLRRIVSLLANNKNVMFVNPKNSTRENDKKKLAGQLN